MALMEATLSHLIADFHEMPLPDLTPRSARWPRVPGKINVVTGMRRAGKTFFCYQAMRDNGLGRPREQPSPIEPRLRARTGIAGAGYV